MNRSKEIAKVGLVSIVLNLLLVGFKSFVGLVSGSVSIISDAINNLSDTASAIVTIVGARFSGKRPDKNHPYGHGKIEYISALGISVLIFATGISLVIESIQKIIKPEVASFNIPMLIIIFAGILVKVFLCAYNNKKGKQYKSEALLATSKDAMFDVVISTATLIGAIISLALGITVDGYIGVLISCFIIKSAIEIAITNTNQLVGTEMDEDQIKNVIKTLKENEEVLGIYDLILHPYGPERTVGSVCIEINDSMTARDIHLLTHEISDKIYNKYKISMTIGIYATNTNDKDHNKIKDSIKEIISSYDSIRQMHGFYVNDKEKAISIDLVFDYKESNYKQIANEVSKKIKQKYPKYSINIIKDQDFTD